MWIPCGFHVDSMDSTWNKSVPHGFHVEYGGMVKYWPPHRFNLISTYLNKDVLSPLQSQPMSQYTILINEHSKPSPPIHAPQPWLTFHVPFPAAQPKLLPLPSSPAHQHKLEMFQDLNKINIPLRALRSISISPEYLSPTIEEIESC